jgi:hypothetical protein
MKPARKPSPSSNKLPPSRKGKAGKPAPKKKTHRKAKPSAPPPSSSPLFGGPKLPTTLEILQVVKTRPAEPTPELIVAICHLIRNGNNAEAAGRAMGVPRFTLRTWIERGLMELEDPKSIFGRFVLAIDTAEAQDEANDILSITLGMKHWPALTWKRERKTPQRWGQKPQPAVDYDAHQPLVEGPKLSLDDAAAVLAIVEAYGGGSSVIPVAPKHNGVPHPAILVEEQDSSTPN